MVWEWIWSIRISPFSQSVKKGFNRESRGWHTLDFTVSFLSLSEPGDKTLQRRCTGLGGGDRG